MKAVVLLALFTELGDVAKTIIMVVLAAIFGAIIGPVLNQVALSPVGNGLTWLRTITKGYWTIILMVSGGVVELLEAMGGIDLSPLLGAKAGAVAGTVLALVGVIMRVFTNTNIFSSTKSTAAATATSTTPAATPATPAVAATPATPAAPPTVAQMIASLQTQLTAAQNSGNVALATQLQNSITALQSVTH